LPLKERFRLFCPTSGEIDVYWPHAAPLIQRALDRGSNYTIDQIYEGLKTSAMQLWLWGSDAAMVTTIQNDEGTRWCLLLAIGGDSMDEWLPCLPIVENWARDCGCSEMRIYGRIGWARRTGYRVDYTKMSKEL